MAPAGTALAGLGLVLLLAACPAAGAGRGPAGVALVTGATGRTGALVYNLLKGKSVAVRGLVRNVTKARELLGCDKCDESEGIYVGDVTEPATLVAPMRGAAALVIATSAEPVCEPYPKCHFPQGASPMDVDWLGAKAQLASFANATARAGLGQVVLISTMGTTEPDSFMDTFQHISFYKLNFEATLMASGLPFTIVKPCGLGDDAPGQEELVVGHDDELKLRPPMVARADVARLVVAAVQQPEASAGLRFDLCAREGAGTPEEGLAGLFKAARYPWQARSQDVGSGLVI